MEDVMMVTGSIIKCTEKVIIHGKMEDLIKYLYNK